MRPDSLGIDVSDEELELGIDRAELYASNVDREIERQRKAYPCVGGRGDCVCVCVRLHACVCLANPVA